jgi:hypothetical protein
MANGVWNLQLPVTQWIENCQSLGFSGLEYYSQILVLIDKASETLPHLPNIIPSPLYVTAVGGRLSSVLHRTVSPWFEGQLRVVR